jgi:hypothetical protein
MMRNIMRRETTYAAMAKIMRRETVASLLAATLLLGNS